MTTEHRNFLILLLFLAIQNPGYSASAHSGQVRVGGVPMPGVLVRAAQGDKKLQAITDLDGTYSFNEIPDGTWTIHVEMQGFVPISHDLTISSVATSTVWELKMLPMSEMQTETNQGFEPRLLTVPLSQSFLANLETAEFAPALPPHAVASFNGIKNSADALLINGSTSSGASPTFGNNRKRGSPRYTGDVSITANNSALNARSFSLTEQATPETAYTRTNASIILSGPFRIPILLRNGPVFTLNYSRAQYRDVNVQAARVPSLVERSGDFSHSSNVPTDPATDLPFHNNVISEERISPQAKALLNLYPVPNLTEGSPFNYQIPIVGVTHRDDLQLDTGGFVSGNQFTGNFYFQSTRTDSPNLFGFVDRLNTTTVNGALSWSRRFTEYFSATANYTFNRTVSRTTPYFAGRWNVSGDLGITGNDQNPRNWGPPNLNFSSGIAGLLIGQYAFDRTQSSAISFNGTWNGGDHNLSFGIGFRREQLNLLSHRDARGTFTFAGAATGNDFADFLLGIPTASTIAFGNPDKYLRQSLYSAYVLDDWRVSSSLTLNFGLRWEYEAPITERHDRLANLDIDPTFRAVAPVLAGQPSGTVTGQIYPRSLIRPDKRGVQPRFGFAWSPRQNSSLVVRAGYGIYRDTAVYRPIARDMAHQAPFSINLSVENSPLIRLTLANGFIASPLNTPNTFAIDPDFRVGYAQNWHLAIQQDLPAALQISAAYVGIRGRHLPQRSLPNTFPSGASNLCSVCPAGYIYMTSYGNSSQHAGTIEMRRRQRNGFAASLQYTWSKAFDDAGLGGFHIAQDWMAPGKERALSNFDRRHQLTFQMQYSTGMQAGIEALWDGWIGTLLRDWRLMTELRTCSGSPLTPVIIAPVQGTGMTGSLRPDRTAAPLYANDSNRFLNPAAFALPGAGNWGNAARNSITGPEQFSWDVSIGRTFRRGDGISIDLRVDVTNVLNRVTFASWNTVINSIQFGLPTRANSMRTVQPSMWVRF